MALALRSLEIEGFRTFDQLTLPRLGRANLFVGRNNSGKSSLLEAIRIFVTRGSGTVLSDILNSRDEMARRHPTAVGDVDIEQAMIAYEQLFHGRHEVWGPDSPIRINEVGGERNGLTIAMDWLDRADSDLLPFADPVRVLDLEGIRRPILIVRFRGESRFLPVDIDLRRVTPRSLRESEPLVRHAFIGPNGLASREAASLWDQIALTDLEDQVVRTLRIISPEIQRISAVGERGIERVIVARTADAKRPVSLRSMGDGMNRLLGIALGMATAQNGVLLVDEIENGIHFSVQERLWELIFREARRLNLQVFATTHSWDCIEAFQRAARRDDGEEAALIRLDNRDGHVWPTTFSEHELSIVAREHLEVR
ncbi:MAG: hypothetical protein JWO56_181 [Acidobacteria bacterium]|nr:hypothetical protein [Acidobacteriota bacterium]